MSDTPPLFLTDQHVSELVTLNDAIAALEVMLRREAQGLAHNIPKALATFAERSSLHGLGSFSEDAALGGFKTWINTPGGASAVMSLFDTDRGGFRALVQAGLLGQLRTAGISGLATDWLAPAEARDMAIIGTGRQATLQIASVAVVRRISRLRVYSPNADSRRDFTARMRGLFSFEIVDCDSAESALRDAEIVTIVTRARAPFIHAGMIADDAHVNAVGAILPANAEIEADVLAKARVVAVDSIAGVRRNSRELIDFYGEDEAAWQAVQTLGRIIAAGRQARRPAGMTLFKSMGMGLSDLAMAEMILDRAAARGCGIPLVGPKVMPLARWSERA